MTTIVYIKSNLKPVATIASNETFKMVVAKDVVTNFGGKESDYASLDVPFDYFKLENVNGEVQAVEVEPSAPEPQPPSEIELLKQENEQLKGRLDEMDAALFDVIIKTSMTI
jgi:hypothetical protein